MIDSVHLYVTAWESGGVFLFDFDFETGTVQFREQYLDGVDGFDALAGAEELVAGPDGSVLYVAGHDDDAIAVLARAPDGTLTPRDVQALPDGVVGVTKIATLGSRRLVALAETEDLGKGVMLVYDLDSVDGRLTLSQSFVEGEDGVVGLPGRHSLDAGFAYSPSTLSTSPDGRHVYIRRKSPQSITVFTTDLHADDFESGDLSRWTSIGP
ncbi:MAG: hypothetical protein AAGC60_07415 [Acidobacteriota bacterium]